MNNTCVQCGRDRQQIKKRKYHCATETNTEAGREVDAEWERHRFKPYSQKELAARLKDEMEYIKQMSDMADFINKEME